MAVRAERARRLPPDARREALIAATLPLVLCHGPGVTTRQIAEAAEVAEGTIFRVFDDKEALIAAAVRRAIDPSETLRALETVDRSLPLRERLVAVVEILQARLTGVFTLLAALRWRPPWDENGPPPDTDEALREAVADIVGDDRRLLRVPVGELAVALRLLVFASAHPRIAPGNPMTSRQIVGIVLDGMLDRSGGNPPC